MADAGDEGGYDEEGHREQEAAAEAVAGGEDDDAAAAAEVGEEGDEDGVIDIIDAATGSETQSSENDPMELMGSDSEDGSGEDYSSSGDEEDRELNSQRRSHMLSTMTFDTSVPGVQSSTALHQKLALIKCLCLKFVPLLLRPPLVSGRDADGH